MTTATTSPTPDEVWSETAARLRNTMAGTTFDIVFGGAHPVTLDEDRLTLAVGTDWARKWVRDRFLTVLRDALFEVLGRDVDVSIVVHPDLAASHGDAGEADGALEAPAEPLPDERRAPGLQSRLTFEAFVIGPSNRLAHGAAVAVAEAPARAYNPLFIYGSVGLGKTHLLHAIGHFVVRNHPGLTFHYASAETFTNEFINALRDGGIRSFKDRYRSTDILAIDDIQSLEGKDGTQEEFFHTFNALFDSGKQIVISSDRPPKAIATLEDRLRSRFEMGLMTDIQPPDLETRIAILGRRVRGDGYSVDDPEVLSFIATRIATNVRALEGALTRVVAQASITGQPVTVDLAGEVLRELYPAGDGVVGIDTIQSEICRYYGVSLDELTGHKRTRRIVRPRQVAMYLSRELTDSSLPAIGRAFGGRDHTTVMHAVEKVRERMATENELYSAVQLLTTRLTGGA